MSLKVKELKKGDIVSDGAMSPHDILALRGLEELNRIHCRWYSRGL